MVTDIITDLEPLRRLTRDLRDATATLTSREARFLVDLYYQIQDDRKRAASQMRAMSTEEPQEPHRVIDWVFGNMDTLESDIKRALDRYSESQRPGQWARSICGIGPVIAAGLLAHIDITRAPTVGHIWRFAGLDPTVKWGKGEKRPWNAGLKVLCWKIGQSFMKVSGNPNDIYGQTYLARKEEERARNDSGALADQAAAVLTAKRIGKDTEAYKAYSVGKLPPAHIDARARRWAVKLFLSHYQAVAWECEYGTPPPKPYILTQEGHVHFIKPPNWPMG